MHGVAVQCLDGVSVENATVTSGIQHLRRTQAHVKCVSLNPLLGPHPKLNYWLRGNNDEST
jgi:protein gp37